MESDHNNKTVTIMRHLNNHLHHNMSFTVQHTQCLMYTLISSHIIQYKPVTLYCPCNKCRSWQLLLLYTDTLIDSDNLVQSLYSRWQIIIRMYASSYICTLICRNRYTVLYLTTLIRNALDMCIQVKWYLFTVILFNETYL